MRTRLQNVLSPEACRLVIRRLESRGFSPSHTDYPPSYRTNERLVFDDPQLADLLYSRVRRFLPSSVRLNERLRACRYGPGQHFGRHRDGVYRDGDSVSRQSFVLYLNDDFRGGETAFEDRSFRASTGDALVFDHALWHWGAEVHEGTKYVLRTDVMVPATTPSASDHQGYVWDVISLQDGRVATCGRDRTVRIWREGSCEVVYAGHTHSPTALLAVEGGLVSGSRDRTVRLWPSGAVIGRHDGAVLCLALLNGEVLSGSADGTIRGWPSGRIVRRHDGWVWGLSVVGGRCVSASEDGTLQDGKKTHRFGAALQALDGMVSGAIDGGVRDGGRLIGQHTAPVRAVCRTPVGVLSGSEDGTVRLWPSGQILHRDLDFVTSLATIGAEAVGVGSYSGWTSLSLPRTTESLGPDSVRLS